MASSCSFRPVWFSCILGRHGKLLLGSILVNDDAMQALVLQRGVAVKEYLASKDLPLERLFSGANNSGKESGKADAKAEVKPDAKWVPRADLNIAM